jgi:hypothetical protein
MNLIDIEPCLLGVHNTMEPISKTVMHSIVDYICNGKNLEAQSVKMCKADYNGENQ